MAEQVATHIVRDEKIMGGKPTIEGYRISVHDIASWLNQGWTPERIADEFQLTLGQVYSALGYYYDHKHEIDRETEEEAAELMALAADAPTAHLTKRVQELLTERRAQQQE